MNKKSFLFLVILIAGSTASSQSNTGKYVQPSDLRIWISYLASDDMKGRRNGSPEMEKASKWIAGKFLEYGVSALLPGGDYIQNYTYSTRQNTVNERNVIGVIEGSDPELKSQYIVLSAHFDHVGIRKTASADSIYNGADDNAAGTSALIGIAKAIRDSKKKPGRSVIIAAFSGEENGMRGSRYFVANSPVPLKDMVVDLNFEMIGHSEFLGRNNYYLTGCSTSNLDDVIHEFEKGSEFHLIDTVKMAERLFNGSDNVAFSRAVISGKISAGIPSGTIATTALADYIHSPGDEAALFDFDNMARLVNHFSELVLWLSDYRGEIKWTDQRFARP